MENLEEKTVNNTKHDKRVYTFPDGSVLVYYQQNYNKCTDVNVGFRIPFLDIPMNEKIGVYKNLVFYMDKNNTLRIPLNKPGIAHFAEHMFYSSIPEFSIKDIQKEFKRTNTINNAATSQDYVKTTFNCPSKFLEEIMNLQSKLVFRNEYSKAEIEAEKRPIFQELEMVYDRNVGLIEDLFENSYSFMKGSEILGVDKLVIDSINAKQLLKFTKTYFTKQNLIMTVVSDLPFEQILPLCQKYFVDKAPSIPETKIYYKSKNYKFNSDMQFASLDKTKKTATIDFILKGSNSYEKNALFENIEDFILNDFNGRLMNKFREENGYTYTPIFDTIDYPHFPLKFFQIQTTPQNVKQCTLLLSQILNDLIENGITDEEYSGFKEMWANRRERKTALKFNTASELFDKVIEQEPIFLSNFYDKTYNITKSDINKYIKEVYARSNLCYYISGNYDKNDIVQIRDILNSYRPYDKYLNKSDYIDKKQISDFENYVKYFAEHTDEKPLIHFVGENLAPKEQKTEKNKNAKTKDKTNKDSKENNDDKNKEKNNDNVAKLLNTFESLK